MIPKFKICSPLPFCLLTLRVYCQMKVCKQIRTACFNVNKKKKKTGDCLCVFFSGGCKRLFVSILYIKKTCSIQLEGREWTFCIGCISLGKE